MIRCVVFDLDGTLTDTLRDLAVSTNFALAQMGWPQRTLDEVRRFVGNGVHKLIERAVPQGVCGDLLEQCFKQFQQHYLMHCQDHTALYPGVAEMLGVVHARGYRTAIVSNKLQAGVDELYDAYFRTLVDVAVGQRQGLPLKPAPDMVDLALAHLGVGRDCALYVGDSEVDVQTARNAGLPCVSVLWGFRDRDQLLQAGASTLISRPDELLGIIDTYNTK